MSRKPSPKDVEAALRALARPGTSPGAIMKAVRRQFPAASKKDIIHAAFAAMIADADSDLDRALTLQNFALSERSDHGD